jgi:hypothetical protein
MRTTNRRGYTNLALIISIPYIVGVADGEPGLVGSIVSAGSAATLFRKIVRPAPSVVLNM